MCLGMGGRQRVAAMGVEVWTRGAGEAATLGKQA